MRAKKEWYQVHVRKNNNKQIECDVEEVEVQLLNISDKIRENNFKLYVIILFHDYFFLEKTLALFLFFFPSILLLHSRSVFYFTFVGSSLSFFLPYPLPSACRFRPASAAAAACESI